MNIQELKLSHFRNYQSASFSFDPECVHVLCGRNAQGKTNLLEAIYFLSNLRTWRTSKTRALIQDGQAPAVIEVRGESAGRKIDLKAVISESKKSLYRYGNPVATYSSFVGIVNAILFCPDDLTLFAKAPKDRRQFMDMELIKLSVKYTSTLSHYQKILKERNLALKARTPNRILLETYTSQMIEDQIILIAQRKKFLDLLQKQAAAILPGFEGKETLEIRYRTFVDPDQDLKSQLEKAYKTTLDKDLQMKTTSCGIHKDDVEFILNGKILTTTASQGQKRSVMLSVKLGLANMIHDKTGQYPILLLDDVFSELDPYRRQQLIRLLPEDMQIFITAAEPVNPAWFERPAKFYTVEHGEMKEGVFDV